jgi:hypothetical protein
MVAPILEYLCDSIYHRTNLVKFLSRIIHRDVCPLLQLQRILIVNRMKHAATVGASYRIRPDTAHVN